MKVFMIRHGESETNRAGVWTGWLNAALTEKGKEEAALVKNLLAGVKFDKVYSSDLIRAKTTAEIAAPGYAYELTPIVREINVGSIAGKALNVVLDSENKPINKDGYAMFGGESSDEFGGRVAAFMGELEGLSCKNVAVFSHGGFLRRFLNTVLGTQLKRDTICCKNCAVAIFEYEGSSWRLHSWINLS